MPAQPRKTTARKPTAAVAARRQVRAENGKPAPLEVPFRGEKFEITLDHLGSARFYMRQKYLEQFGVNADGVVNMLFELLGKADSARFIALCGPGDTIFDAAAEFMTAVNKAGNVPNS